MLAIDWLAKVAKMMTEKVWRESIGEILFTFVNCENVGRLNACGSTVAVQLTAAVLALFYIKRRIAGTTGGGSANKKIAQLTKSFLSLILYSTPLPISWYTWLTLIPLIGSRTFQRPTFLAEISFLLLIFFLVLYSSFCYVVLPRAALVVVDRSVMLILPFLGIVLAYLRSCN
jgi:hypothetical protein